MDGKKLKARRGGHRSHVSTIIDKITCEINRDTPDQSKIDIWCTELIRQKEIILDYDKGIIDLLEDSDISVEITNASDFIVKVDTILKQVKSTDGNENNSSKSQTKNVKLPNLTLIKFSGDPLQWTKFWDLFRTSIHVKSDIASPAKFQYLIAQLEGEAANLFWF